MEELIINFAPTGMVPTHDMSPYVPIEPAAIVEQVHEAYEIGITVVHLHARDPETGGPTYKSTVYGPIVERLRKLCPDLVIGVSLSGRDFGAFEQRAEALEVEPDMGSLTLSSLNFSRQASVNAPDMVQRLATVMRDKGVKPELEVFDLGMINYARYLIGRDLLRPPYYFNILTGNVAGIQVDPSSIGAALAQLPEGSYWALAGLGRNQFTANAVAVALGGGVRVGLEDNLYLDKMRNTLATNTDLLRRIHMLAEMHERPIMKSRNFGELGFYNKNRIA